MDRVLAFVGFAFGNAGSCEVWSASIMCKGTDSIG